MVVEGWVPPYTLKEVASEFRQGHYQHVLVVKPIYEEIKDNYESGRYAADYIANFLVEYGVPQDRVRTVFCPVTRRDRTYFSALASKKWLAQNRIAVKAIDAVTLGPHARRSRLLYEKALGKQVSVGVIALQEWEYDPAHWWRSSRGTREMLGEGVAYLYARLFFHPSAEEEKSHLVPTAHETISKN